MNIFTFTKLGRALLLSAVMVIGAAGLSVFGAGSFSVYGQTKTDDILKLFKVNGTEQMTSTIITQYRQMLPGVPATFWVKLEKKFGGELMYKCVPVFDKYYTHDEIKQLIKFYESPIGKKTVEISPLMMQETMAIGADIGKKIAEDVMAEGYGR